jgi:hypothetical protein
MCNKEIFKFNNKNLPKLTHYRTGIAINCNSTLLYVNRANQISKWFHGVMVITSDFDSDNLSPILSETYAFDFHNRGTTLCFGKLTIEDFLTRLLLSELSYWLIYLVI